MILPLNQVICGDVYDTLRTLPSNSFAAGIADGPYGTGLRTVDWDDLADFGLWIEETMRVLIPGGSLFVFGRPETVAANWHRFQEPKDMFAWHAPNRVQPRLNWWQPSWDAIAVVSKGKPRFFPDQVRIEYSPRYKKLLNKVRPATPGGRFGSEESIFADRGGTLPKDVIIASALVGRHGLDQRVGHPTPKPIDLIKHLIAGVTLPGEPVLDLFAGGGTSSAAALLLGRKFLAIEREPRYVEMIKARIAKINAASPDERIRFDFDASSKGDFDASSEAGS